MTDEQKLAVAERLVLESAEKIARLKARIEAVEKVGKTHSPDQNKMKELEVEQAQLVEKRNALFREVAGNDY